MLAYTSSYRIPNAIFQSNKCHSQLFSCILRLSFLLDRDRMVVHYVSHSAFPSLVDICRSSKLFEMAYMMVIHTVRSVEFQMCQVHRYSALGFDLNHENWHHWNPTVKKDLVFDLLKWLQLQSKYKLITISSANMMTIFGLLSFVLWGPWLWNAAVTISSSKRVLQNSIVMIWSLFNPSILDVFRSLLTKL